jgi:predicted transcriptional regulator
MKLDNKTEMLTIRIDKETKGKLQLMADKDRRSLSDYIRLQLEKLVELIKKEN